MCKIKLLMQLRKLAFGEGFLYFVCECDGLGLNVNNLRAGVKSEDSGVCLCRGRSRLI